MPDRTQLVSEETIPDSLSRVLRVNTVDEEAGTFRMTLATEGEASDGHILSIDGGEIPARMPMLVSHWNDPTTAAGSIMRARKHLSESPPRLSAIGMMELDGEGDAAEMRRDLMHMIGRGHVNAVSIRWDFDPKHVMRRTELPKDHPHFVDADREPMGSQRRYGLYFKRWRALEGSIVAVGADKGALIGRADQSEGKLAEFYRALAADAEEASQPKPAAEPSPESLLAAFAAQCRELVARGLDYEALVREIESAKPESSPDVPELVARIAALEKKLESVEGRVSGAPTPPSVIEQMRSVMGAIRDDREAALAKAQERLKKMTGRVSV